MEMNNNDDKSEELLARVDKLIQNRNLASQIMKNQTVPNRSNANDKTNKTTQQNLHRYTSSDYNFHVYMESTNVDGNAGNIHPMTMGKIINMGHPTIKNNILNIDKIGRNRVRIELQDYVSANTLLDLQYLKQNNFTTYVPYYMQFRRGVIRNVDLTFTEEEIQEDINYSGNMKLANVKRIMRKVNGDLVKTSTVILSFIGQQMPQYIFIHSVRCSVVPYIQNITQCYKCHRFNHISSQCRAKNERCSKCSEEHKSQECPMDTLKCVNCQGEHDARNKCCPEKERQRRIKKTMAYNNMSYRDATLSLDNNSYAQTTRFGLLQSENLQEFPLLENPNKNYKKNTSTS